MSSGGAETRAKDIQSVVGTGGVDVEGTRIAAQEAGGKEGEEIMDGKDTEMD